MPDWLAPLRLFGLLLLECLAFLERFLSRGLASQLEFRSRREILNVVGLIVRTGQRLAADVDLATGQSQRGTHAQAIESPPPGMPSFVSLPHPNHPPWKRTRENRRAAYALRTLEAALAWQTQRIRYNPHPTYRPRQSSDFHMIEKLLENAPFAPCQC